MRHHTRSIKLRIALPWKTFTLGAMLLCCLWLATACSDKNATVPPETASWFGSADELVLAVTQAVSANDRAALERYRISREEYMAIVWPGLPVSKIEQWKGQSGFVWSQHAAKSDSGLREVLARFGGKPLQVRLVKFGAPPQDYGEFKIHGNPELLPPKDNTPGSAPRLMGSMIEKAGRYKIFSYNIEQ